MKRLLKFAIGLALLALIVMSANRLPTLPEVIPEATASDPVEKPEATVSECTIQDWKFTGYPAINSIEVQGTTTCAKGEIHIRVFDGDNWIRNAHTYIDGYMFKTFLQGTAPQRMSMKYTVEQR